MKEQIVELRIKLDGLAQLTKELRPIKIERATFENNVGNIKTKNDLQYIDEGVIVILEKSNSKEVEKAYNSLILAKAWLGKVYTGLEDIEPTDDKMNPVTNRVSFSEQPVIHPYNHFVTFRRTQWQDKSQGEKVTWLIQEIQKIHEESQSVIHANPNKMVNILGFEQHIQEAKMWLNFELWRLRDAG